MNVFRKFRPSFDFSKSDKNYHGTNRQPLRSTWQIVRMGSYAKCWSLYVYNQCGHYRRFELRFGNWLGPWPSDKMPKD